MNIVKEKSTKPSRKSKKKFQNSYSLVQRGNVMLVRTYNVVDFGLQSTQQDIG